MKEKESCNLLSKIKILEELGYDLKPESMVLDFGCGEGKAVHEWRDHGYQAFGCDIKLRNKNDTDAKSICSEDIIRPINPHPYTLPFEDNTFDFIYSDQVFEHVQSYSKAISEINRILKPNGCCLHIFPSRYKAIESHTNVPFSSIFKPYPWLFFWAMMGIRNKFQTGLSAKETVNRNYNYLVNSTNYLTKTQITKAFKRHFNEVVYAEKVFLKYSPMATQNPPPVAT